MSTPDNDKGLPTKTSHTMNARGECCCTCKFQCELFKHPWNTIHKGSIDQPTGLYACLARYSLSGDAQGTIYESKHGLCELYTPKGENVSQTARINPDPLIDLIFDSSEDEWEVERDSIVEDIKQDFEDGINQRDKN